MRAIINGKRYDTETATRVAVGGNDLPVNDFREYSESLYRTPRGNWFLYGKGGPMTKYKESCGNGWTSGSRFFALTPEEAREWLEAERETDVIEQYFGDQVEDA